MATTRNTRPEKRTGRRRVMAVQPKARAAHFRSREEGLVAGKVLRARLPRERHAAWKRPARGRDPIAILEKTNQDRMSETIPVRHGRMLRSPFTFFRGAAALMAYDLATTPSTGLRVQACGDCHLLNFGLFATPERNLVFDVNDFDETLPAPWEWDLKRLATSFVVAARDNNFAKDAQAVATECVRAYREHLREDSKKSPLDVWYEHLDMEDLIKKAPDARARKLRKDVAELARQRIGEHLFPRIASGVAGQHRLVDQPPILFHIPESYASRKKQEKLIADGMENYRRSLLPSVRVLYDRYRREDWAVKVVGIGSVGTRCFVGLYFSADGHPLLLQIKEARRSVLAPYAGKSVYQNEGQRVVVGQRLMQSSSDIFLGWTSGQAGHDYYVRQLRDMKFSFPIEGLSRTQLMRYAEVCGLTLARAHAKSGDAAAISGYLGKSNDFDEAIGRFALAYADQNERDHAAMMKAVKVGRIQALVEEDL